MEQYTQTSFNGLVFLLEVGKCLIDDAIDVAINGTEKLTSDSIWNAIEMVERVAYSVGLGEIEWDESAFLAAYPEFDILYWRAYTSGSSSAREQEIAKSSGEFGSVVYCPKGCNQVVKSHAVEECASCGSIMRVDAEDDYYDALKMCGQVM